LLPSSISPIPLPYSIGVDSDTNMAIVAYSSGANPTTAKVGFLLDLNKDSQTCLSGAAQTLPPCPHAQVTLNTGLYPQIALVPHSHLAYVTPGGIGTMSGIDVAVFDRLRSKHFGHLRSGYGAGGLPAGQTLGLNPAIRGSLIQGVRLPAQCQLTALSPFNRLNSTTFAFAPHLATASTATARPILPIHLTKNPCDVSSAVQDTIDFTNLAGNCDKSDY
jgi:hypothetical protein